MVEAMVPEPDMLEGEAVLGLDNVRLDLPIAGAASRSLACFLDYCLLGFLMFVWSILSLILSMGLLFSSLSSHFAEWILAIWIVGNFLLNWSYFAGFEIVMGGRTPGKRALGLRVVTREGGRAGAGALLMRNLLRPIDLFVGVPMMVLDSLARRLGDRVAGTVVTRETTTFSELVIQKTPAGWSAKEVAFLEAFLARVDELEVDRAQQLARRILDWIERDDPELLEGLSSREDPVTALKAFAAREAT